MNLTTTVVFKMIETNYSNSSFQFKHMNTKDVQNLFENLNPRKSCSGTGIMPNLHNRCIESSNWSGIWKRGELTPIFKKRDKHNVGKLSTYRGAFDY